MQKPSFFISSLAAILLIFSVSSCRKTITVGNKPNIEFVAGTERIIGDSTLVKDKKYKIEVKTDRAEDNTPNTTLEIVRTYSGTADTTVYYHEMIGDEQVSFNYAHTFTTLKKAGTERFTFTVKNNYGIINQKILIMTVK